MSLAVILGLVVVVVAALIAFLGGLRSDRFKAKREDRSEGRDAFWSAKEAWDQSQADLIIEGTTQSMREQLVKKSHRDLLRVRSVLGVEIETEHFGRLVELLEGDLSEPSREAEIAECQKLWPTVQEEMILVLSGRKRGRQDFTAHQ